jgi:archaellum component FlaG (FlaF/FlaG flagellin family)
MLSLLSKGSIMHVAKSLPMSVGAVPRAGGPSPCEPGRSGPGGQGRLLSLLTIASLLLAVIPGSPATTLARQETPALGTSVPLIGQDGSEIARITVTEIVDPFMAYEPGNPTDRGYRAIIVTLTVENTGTQPFAFDPSAIYLVDTEGYVVQGVYIVLLPNTGVTPLESQEIAPGASVSGSLGFEALVGVELSEVVYWPSSERFVTLARLFGSGPPLGSTVPIVANDGSLAAEVTVSAIEDPFADFEASSPPQRGNRYVRLTLTVANVGVRPYRVDPNAFYLSDADGFFAVQRSIPVPEGAAPPLAFTDPLEPGAEVSGAIGFELLAGVPVASLLYQPAGDRLIEVADLTATGTAATAEPVATTAPAATTGPAAECEGLADYIDATDARFATTAQLTDALSPLEELTVADIRAASTTIGDLAQEQTNELVPPIAEEFNPLAVELFTGISNSLDFLAGGLESGDAATQIAALLNIQEAQQAFASGEALDMFNAMLAACPQT